jgi:hypothetical protein
LRWREEIILLEEEMRRAVDFSRTMSCYWKARKVQSHRVETTPSYILEGIRAYAIEQSETEELRANTWGSAWRGIRAKAKEVLEKALKEDIEEDFDLSEVIVPDIDSLDIDI